MTAFTFFELYMTSRNETSPKWSVLLHHIHSLASCLPSAGRHCWDLWLLFHCVPTATV